MPATLAGRGASPLRGLRNTCRPLWQNRVNEVHAGAANAGGTITFNFYNQPVQPAVKAILGDLLHANYSIAIERDYRARRRWQDPTSADVGQPRASSSPRSATAAACSGVADDFALFTACLSPLRVRSAVSRRRLRPTVDSPRLPA